MLSYLRHLSCICCLQGKCVQCCPVSSQFVMCQVSWMKASLQGCLTRFQWCSSCRVLCQQWWLLVAGLTFINAGFSWCNFVLSTSRLSLGRGFSTVQVFWMSDTWTPFAFFAGYEDWVQWGQKGLYLFGLTEPSAILIYIALFMSKGHKVLCLWWRYFFPMRLTCYLWSGEMHLRAIQLLTYLPKICLWRSPNQASRIPSNDLYSAFFPILLSLLNHHHVISSTRSPSLQYPSIS